MGSNLEVRHLYACAICDTVRALKAPLKEGEVMSCAACKHGTEAKRLTIATQEPGTTAAMLATVSTVAH